jgi:uncharacterized protein (TIGR03083 family)
VQLKPRYGDEPVVVVDVRVGGVHPLVAQRRRMVEVLAALDDADWGRPSRCTGWTVQDVVNHLVTTNGFWDLSIQAGLAGDPTRFLSTFDPVASPAALADQHRGTSVSDTRSRFADGSAALAATIEGLDDAGWDVLAEAPPGHLPVRLVADHALWDAWVHERDILLPLGHEPVVADDEILTCLRYAAALGQAFTLCEGSMATGAMGVRARDPSDELVVTVDGRSVRISTPRAGSSPAGWLEGSAVDLVEMLSARDVDAPRPAALDWFVAGLATAFDQKP